MYNLSHAKKSTLIQAQKIRMTFLFMCKCPPSASEHSKYLDYTAVPPVDLEVTQMI